MSTNISTVSLSQTPVYSLGLSETVDHPDVAPQTSEFQEYFDQKPLVESIMFANPEIDFETAKQLVETQQALEALHGILGEETQHSVNSYNGPSSCVKTLAGQILDKNSPVIQQWVKSMVGISNPIAPWSRELTEIERETTLRCFEAICDNINPEDPHFRATYDDMSKGAFALLSKVIPLLGENVANEFIKRTLHLGWRGESPYDNENARYGLLRVSQILRGSPSGVASLSQENYATFERLAHAYIRNTDLLDYIALNWYQANVDYRYIADKILAVLKDGPLKSELSKVASEKSAVRSGRHPLWFM